MRPRLHLLTHPSFLLACILALALFLRLYNLGGIPYGLHEDEMMNGYVGRFVLLHGKDLYGNSWPLLYFDNFGDFPTIMPMYLSGLFTFVFGVTPFAIRFPIAVMGALAVLPAYVITRRIFANASYGLVAALFIAIMPWHIVLSRSTAENVTASTVLLTALAFLLSWFETKRARPLVISVVLCVSMYVLYPTSRIIVPLLFVVTALLVRPLRARQISVGIALGFFLLTGAIASTPWGKGRFAQTSIFHFNNQVAHQLDDLARGEGPGNVLIARIFHNKPIGYTREFIRQYLSYFSFDMLFDKGGLPGRYKQEDHGLLYISFLAMTVLAIGITMFWHTKEPEGLFTKNGRVYLLLIALMLLIAPIPSALTLDDVPNVHRTVLMALLIPIVLIFAYAKVDQVKFRRYSLVLPIFLVLSLEVVYFWHQWMVHSPTAQTVARGDDRTALARYLIEHARNYETVYLPQDAKPLYYLFFSNTFDASLAGQFGPNIRLPRVHNLIYSPINCPVDEPTTVITKRTLVIERGECDARPQLKQIYQTARVNMTGSFRIYELDMEKVTATKSATKNLQRP